MWERTGSMGSGKQSKRERALALFLAAQRDYLCPVCQENLILSEAGTFRCKKGHSFDLSAKGYVNFLPNQKPVSYDRELFENRSRVFAAGFYDGVLRAIGEIIDQHGGGVDGAKLNVLDVGCGEGFYSAGLSRDPRLAGRCGFFAMDISKDAILLAAQNPGQAAFMVADLARLPWKRKRIDVLLDVLTPANYGEYFRVLKDDGILVKVIPGRDYLREVRQAAAEQLVNKEYDNEEVLSYFRSHAETVSRRRVRETFPVERELAEAFLRMTPMTQRVDLSRVDGSGIRTITIDLEILVGRKK